MLPLHLISGGFAMAATLVFALPREYQTVAWVLLAVSFVGIATLGCVSLKSRILGPCVTLGPEKGNRVALTYDDGPGVVGTPEILDLLEDRGVTANFFCIGKHAAAHPDLVRQMHAAGHLVGNHSQTHTPRLTFTTVGGLRADLMACQDTLAEITGERPAYFRPPYGLRSHATHPAATSAGMQVIGWSTGGGDLSTTPADDVSARITSELTAGSIILLHDRGPTADKAVEITRVVLDALQARRLKPVRLDELLADADGKSSQG